MWDPEYVRDLSVKVILDRTDDGERRLREDGEEQVRKDAQFYDSLTRSYLKAMAEVGYRPPQPRARTRPGQPEAVSAE